MAQRCTSVSSTCYVVVSFTDTINQASLPLLPSDMVTCHPKAL
jgi:hypothetical protein